MARKITSDYLFRAALFYLERYASSRRNLERVLTRKIRRRAAENDVLAEDYFHLIPEAIASCAELGLLDDESYSRLKLRSGERKGQSRRKVGALLSSKGVDSVTQATAEAEQGYNEHKAIAIYMRKRRLGAFRLQAKRGLSPQEQRLKDLQSLARAGFPQSLARSALGASIEELEALIYGQSESL
ncbi:regulatory protein RecX [Polycladidibacter hongkongensis]|uniref:regulatory protein RecX n=1 Tax=Polycladidibacter hongkongensis TaxID=1647556 RepID=UPI0008300447|nr:RecX family transcriptional regulator [Pseudovibrio hongkongensis]